MTVTEILSLLSWVLPPLLGAVIGYITNAIAIRMLFRPLRPIYLFKKIQLPFTPGVIPRQRAQLAESIGNMVHRNLITVETLYGHLNTESIKQGILQNISTLSGEVIHKPVSELDQNQLELFYSSLDKFLARTLKNLFTSESFRSLLKKALGNVLNSLAEEKIGGLIEKTNIREILISYVLPFLTGEKMKKLLSRQLNGWVNKRLQDNTPLAELIPEGFVKVFTGIFRSFLPDLLAALFDWLRTPEIKTTLETQGRELLKSILKRLTNMQKFFISVGQYDKTLENKMPEIVDDALQAIESGAQDEATQATFIESVEEGIIKWEATGLFDLFYKQNVDVNEKIDLLIDKFFATITVESARSHITTTINDIIAANSGKTIRDVIEGNFKTDLGRVEDFIYKHMIRYLSDDASVNKLSPAIVKLIIDLINNMEDSSLARLFNIDTATKEKIDSFLLNKLYETLERKLPEVMTSFNVKALVVNKINSLNIEEVERLLMMVIERHLKWINVFGALLGAIIGLSQLLFRLFG